MLAQLAHDLRSSEIKDWDDAARMIEARRPTVPSSVTELLDEAAKAVRDRAIDA